jgi:hypothetical protein
MASPAQMVANTSNAQLSTGPRTAAGKAASSQNAAKHHLTSAFRVLAHEDQAEFDALLNGLRAEHRPSTCTQEILIEQVARSWWLLARAQRLEAKAFDYLAGYDIDPNDADAVIVERMYETNAHTLLTLQRYALQAEKSHFKALRELKAAKKKEDEPHAASSQPSIAPVRAVSENPQRNEANSAAPPVTSRPADPSKPSLRSQMPDNLALCL